MRRIPYGGRTVADNLVAASEVQIASKDGEELLAPVHLPRDFRDLHKGFRFLFEYADRVNIAPQDSAYFIDRLLLLLTSCEERRFAEYERQSWWDLLRRGLAQLGELREVPGGWPHAHARGGAGAER